ncbi:MAG: ParB/RepB/Spo0J family partition protein [Pseudomonadota bacterium]|nr:ParB/RepB/Spo0J family partition protein [Pseudomonadota bacterium]
MTDTKKRRTSEEKIFSAFTLDHMNENEQCSLSSSGIHSDLDQISMLEISVIVSNPNQPRKYFDQESIRELAESIRENGLLQPILVREVGKKYEIIAGERRYQAAKVAELFQVPCIIKNMDDAEAFKVSLLENLQREDMDPFEEASGYKHFQDKYGMTQEDIAKAVNKKQSTVSEIMTLNKIPEPIRSNYRLTDIPRTHLIEIAKADSEKTMHKLIELAQLNRLSARDLRAAKKNINKDALVEPKNLPIYILLVKKINSYNKDLTKLFSIEPGNISEDDRLKLIKRLEDHIEKTREAIGKLRLQR